MHDKQASNIEWSLHHFGSWKRGDDDVQASSFDVSYKALSAMCLQHITYLQHLDIRSTRTCSALGASSEILFSLLLRPTSYKLLEPVPAGKVKSSVIHCYHKLVATSSLLIFRLLDIFDEDRFLISRYELVLTWTEVSWRGRTLSFWLNRKSINERARDVVDERHQSNILVREE